MGLNHLDLESKPIAAKRQLLGVRGSAPLVKLILYMRNRNMDFLHKDIINKHLTNAEFQYTSDGAAAAATAARGGGRTTTRTSQFHLSAGSLRLSCPRAPPAPAGGAPGWAATTAAAAAAAAATAAVAARLVATATATATAAAAADLVEAAAS